MVSGFSVLYCDLGPGLVEGLGKAWAEEGLDTETWLVSGVSVL